MEQTAIHLSGEEQFSQSREKLFDCLTDLTFMAKTVPGLEKIEHVEPKSLRCRVKPGFSFLAGSMKLAFEITDEKPPDEAIMRVKGKGIGSSVTIETAVKLVSENNETKLQWNSEVKELTGLSKIISRGLVEAAAKKINQETWSSFRRALDEAEGVS